MRIEIARPVRREPARATALAQLQRAFEVAEFDVEARQPGGTGGHAGSRRDAPATPRVRRRRTAVAGVVIALVWIPD